MMKNVFKRTDYTIGLEWRALKFGYSLQVSKGHGAGFTPTDTMRENFFLLLGINFVFAFYVPLLLRPFVFAVGANSFEKVPLKVLYIPHLPVEYIVTKWRSICYI